jgi:zinc transport system substrate-binding protein
VAALAVLAAGCGAAPGGAGSTSTGGGPLTVAASFYPLAFATEQVGGPDVRVRNLTAPGAEPHDIELTPRQVGELAQAQLVVYLEGFQPAVDEAVAQNAADRAVDVAAGARPRSPDAEETHGQEDAHAGSDEHGRPAADPHLWLDPVAFAGAAAEIGRRLAAADAEHAAAYRSRTETFTARLQALDTDLRTGLAHCERRTFVTSHAAFGYLAGRYGLTQIAVSGLSPESEPSPARLAEVARLTREAGVRTIFFETLVSPKAARTLAAELGVATAVLDPVEGVAAGSRSDYFSVMRANLAALRAALGCT